MLNEYKKIFDSESDLYAELFDSCAEVVTNNECYFKGVDEIRMHYQELKNGLSHSQYTIEKILFEDDEKINFTWHISGIHSGIFLGYLPTQKTLAWGGMTTLFFKNKKIFKLYSCFNQKSIESQISAAPQKTFSSEEIFNDLNGEAKDIYKFILSSREKITDTKQVLVNALRESMLKAPDLKLLNHALMVDIKEKTTLQRTHIELKDRSIELFVYTPKGEESNIHLPTILYLHGGGWCIGSPEQYDVANRKLALATCARVICPRYRLCPEHPYPAGFDDCCETYLALRAQKILFINTKKIIVAGDSVGGGFAAALTLRMHDENNIAPDGLMLLSPATDLRLENYDSYNKYTYKNIMIDQGVIGFIRGVYVQGDQWDHPYVSPMRGDLSCFPKTFVMIGEADPLFDENMAFAKKVSQMSSQSCYVLMGKNMPHHYHTFIGFADAVEEAYQNMQVFVENI